MKCGRCKKSLTDDTAECCWWCTGWLCKDCWEEFGHCGHPEAEEQNRLARLVPQPLFDEMPRG